MSTEAKTAREAMQNLVRQYFEVVQKPMDATRLPEFFHDDVRFHSEMGTLRGLKQFEYLIRSLFWPIVVDGSLELPTGHVVGIERAHLEEDTGKSTHVGGAGRIKGADFSLVDYNRAGVPLLEIVSRPHVRSAEQARLYVSELRAILVACGVSDGKMEEGSLRVDANISVRPEGTDELRTRWTAPLREAMAH